MTPHEALLHLAMGSRSRPTYLRVEYSLCPGHFFVRSRGGDVWLSPDVSTRDSREERFRRSPNMKTEGQIIEWLQHRVISKATEEQAKFARGAA